jgi:hypothetical protein
MREVLWHNNINAIGKTDEDTTVIFFLEYLKYTNVADFFKPVPMKELRKQMNVRGHTHDQLIEMLINEIEIDGCIYIWDKLRWDFYEDMANELGIPLDKNKELTEEVRDEIAYLKILDLRFPGLYDIMMNGQPETEGPSNPTKKKKKTKSNK